MILYSYTGIECLKFGINSSHQVISSRECGCYIKIVAHHTFAIYINFRIKQHLGHHYSRAQLISKWYFTVFNVDTLIWHHCHGLNLLVFIVIALLVLGLLVISTLENTVLRFYTEFQHCAIERKNTPW